MFNLPPPADGEGGKADIEGTIDEKPVHLPGVTVREFSNLLKLFYNRYAQREYIILISSEFASLLVIDLILVFPTPIGLIFRPSLIATTCRPFIFKLPGHSSPPPLRQMPGGF